MSDSDWEDIAIGAPLGVADDGWEDVAIGPPTPKEPVPSIWNDPVGALTSSDWWTTRPDGSQHSALGPLLAAGSGLTLGTMDEIVAGGNAALDALGGGSFGDAYDQRLAQVRGAEKEYRAESPMQSLLIDVLGAANLPVKSLVGQRASMAGRAGQAALEGGALGAAYGFGSGEGGAVERAKNAAIVGTVGAGTGAVAVPVIEATVATARAVADKAAQYGLTPRSFLDLALQKGPASERGSISLRDTGERGYTPEELFLAKQLKDTPTAAVDKAAAELAQTTSDDIPLFLPEALESPKVTRNARFIANYEPSMEMAQRAIQERSDEAVTRAVGALDTVSDQADAFAGASAFTQGADDIIGAAEGRRSEMAAPLYGRAYAEKPTIDAPELVQLLEKDKVLQKAIGSVKQTANNADLPDNATELLVKARHEIGNLIEGAKAQGLGRKARDLTDTYNRLNGILKKENPLLAEADEAFEVASRGIDELNDTFLSSLRSISPDKVQNVGQVFNLPASRIADLRSRFIAAGKEAEWNAGIRAHLQNTIEGTTDGRNFTSKITGNTLQREKLKAALGESYEGILRRFQLEDRMFKGRNAYNAGSSTAGNLQEAQGFEDAIGMLGNIKDEKTWIKALKSFFGGDLSEEMAQNMARIYFDPKRGMEALGKIRPLLEDYARNKAAADAAKRALSFTATRSPAAYDQAFGTLMQDPSRGAASSAGSRSTEPALQSPARSSKSASSESKEVSPSEDFKPVSTTTQGALGTLLPAVLSIGGDSDMQIEPNQLPRLINAVIGVESAGNPKAVSKKGAQGLMQVMPATAREIAEELGIDSYDLKDPETNKLFGAHYLQKMLDLFDGDVELALTAYNQGPNRVKKLLERTKGTTLADIIDHLGPDGRGYARKVLRRFNRQVTA